LPRDLSRSPLFQVFFVYQNAFTPLNLNLKLGELELIPFRNSGDVISGVSRYDLSLFVVETRDSVRFVFQYSTALFQAETIQRMMGHFQTLFESVVANPTAPVSELNLLTAAEREQLLVQWNATQAEYPAHLCLHQLVEQQVEQTPDAIAVRFGTQQLTYRELNLRAEILAAELGLQDIGPGDRVGVCLERGLEMLVAVLGILKSGAAYVPLDPAFPTERLELIITDAQLAAILTQFSVVDRLPVIDTHLLYVDDLDWRQNSGTRNPEPEKPGFRVPGSPAYVIYTSGSTGRPKGVVIPHRAVVNFLCSMQRQPGLTPQDRLLAVTTLSFDIAGLELFLPLVTGACVVIASQDAVRDGVQLAQLLSNESITVMQATPATWKLLLESGWNPSHKLKILCGGEALSRDLADQLLAGGGEVWNLYGPTETTIWSTLLKVEPGTAPVSIGRPIANTQAFILDAHQQPVPIGVVGELYLGGDGVALGYWQRPELTEGRFLVTGPLSLAQDNNVTTSYQVSNSKYLVRKAKHQVPSTKYYQTGDLARW
ncbi:MAG TPA: amino acid adenylation domain-containing protein, partial [Acidobacteriota bacterium]|nr:amino acid adenylation domain-containing protein [Acidobacteriota bacterium]